MLAQFAQAAATRYSGHFDGLPRVVYWQALNEPNLSLCFNPQLEEGRAVSPKLYRQLVNAFYSGIKSAQPSDFVVAAGLGPIEVHPAMIGSLKFTRELLCMAGRDNPHPTKGNCEGGVHFDIFDIHPYTTGGPSYEGHANDVELGSLSKLQVLLIGPATTAGWCALSTGAKKRSRSHCNRSRNSIKRRLAILCQKANAAGRSYEIA